MIFALNKCLLPVIKVPRRDLGQKMILNFRAECCHGAFRADLATDSRAGGDIFPFHAENDTPFLRRTLPQSIPGGFGHGFLRRRLHFCIPGGKGCKILRGMGHHPASLEGRLPKILCRIYNNSIFLYGPLPFN